MDVRRTRVTRGAYRPLDGTDPRHATLRAWLTVLPPGTSFTHVTAAELLGLWLPSLPPQPAVVVQLPPGAHPVRRDGLRGLRGAVTGAPWTVHGLPEALRGACSPGRHGAPRLRRLLSLADARTESPWETVLREFHRQVDAAVTPQFEVWDSCGRFVARGDFRVASAPVLHEYDGEVHRTIAQHRADLLRDRRLQELGWSRRGYTSQDLVHRQVGLLRDVDRTLGRPHSPARLTAWQDTLRTSTLTRSGRARTWPRLLP